MIIIWRGLGILVVGVVLVCILVGRIIFDLCQGDGYFDNHHWTMALCLIISAASCWTLGTYLQTKSEAADKEAGDHATASGARHTLFFIPIHYWAPILLVVALYQVLH
jgi:hypothetical protein